jgi:hypothetical protein
MMRPFLGAPKLAANRGMTAMKSHLRLPGAVIAALALASAASPALAQSAPPYGYWSTADGGERLLITQSAQCSLADGQGRITVSGSCSWNASYGGGILTIMSAQNYRPAPIYFNVVWVNATTITVEGDTFYKRAG